MEERVVALLQRLQADADEALAEYVASMLTDDDSGVDERVENAAEFLAESTEQDVSTFQEPLRRLLSDWEEETRARQAKEEEERRQRAQASLDAAASALSSVSLDATKQAAAQGTKARSGVVVPGADELGAPQMDEETKRRLVEQYTAVSDSEGEEDEAQDGPGHPRTRPVSEKKLKRQRKEQNAADLAASFENTNRVDAAMVRKKKMEEKRQAELSQKVKNKADLVADKERKAKEKEARRKKAEKVERRR